MPRVAYRSLSIQNFVANFGITFQHSDKLVGCLGLLYLIDLFRYRIIKPDVLHNTIQTGKWNSRAEMNEVNSARLKMIEHVNALVADFNSFNSKHSETNEVKSE